MQSHTCHKEPMKLRRVSQEKVERRPGIAVTHLSQRAHEVEARVTGEGGRGGQALQSHTCHKEPMKLRRASQEKVERRPGIAVTHLSQRAHEVEAHVTGEGGEEARHCSHTPVTNGWSDDTIFQ